MRLKPALRLLLSPPPDAPGRTPHGCAQRVASEVTRNYLVPPLLVALSLACSSQRGISMIVQHTYRAPLTRQALFRMSPQAAGYEYNCCGSGMEFESDRDIGCTRCNAWHHARCIGSAAALAHARKNLAWVCPKGCL